MTPRCLSESDLSFLDINGANEQEASVVCYNSPEKLEKLMDFSLPEIAGGVEGNSLFAIIIDLVIIIAVNDD